MCAYSWSMQLPSIILIQFLPRPKIVAYFISFGRSCFIVQHFKYIASALFIIINVQKKSQNFKPGEFTYLRCSNWAIEYNFDSLTFCGGANGVWSEQLIDSFITIFDLRFPINLSYGLCRKSWLLFKTFCQKYNFTTKSVKAQFSFQNVYQQWVLSILYAFVFLDIITASTW